MPIRRFPALEVETFDLGEIQRNAAALESNRLSNWLAVRRQDLAEREFDAQTGRQNRLADATRNAIAEAQGQNAAAPQNRLAPPSQGTAGAAPSGVSAPASSGQSRSALAELAAIDPGRAKQIQDIYSSLDDRQRESAMRDLEVFASLLKVVKGAPPERREEAYRRAREIAIKRGADPAQIPEAYDETFIDLKIAEVLGAAEVLAQGQGFTLSEGQTRFGPDGQPIASLPKSPGGDLTPAQRANNVEIAAARKAILSNPKYRNLDAEKIARFTTETRSSGLDNPDYDANLATLLRRALQRKVGDDPEFERLYRQWYGAVPPDVPPLAGLGVPGQEGGLANLGAGLPQPGGQGLPTDAAGGSPGVGLRKPVDRMSLAEVTDLLLSPDGEKLSPAQRAQVDRRLTELGK
jgi:hypothetical protein